MRLGAKAIVGLGLVWTGVASAQTIDTSRNQIGRLTAIESGDLRRFFEYDDLGRAVRTEHVLEGQPYVYGNTFGYPVGTSSLGPGSVARSMTFPDGERIDYAYDASGAQQSIRTTPQTGVTQDVVRGMRRNARGQTIRVEYGDGSVTTHAYNENTDLRLNRILTQRSTTNPDPIQSYVYSFDPNGNVRGITDELVSAFSATYDYDSLDQIIVINPGTPQQETYVYDPVGNLTAKRGRMQTYGGSGRGPHALATTTKDAITDTYTYDFNGNVATTSSGTAITWNAENMATKVVQGGVVKNEKLFLGEAVWKKVEEGVTTLYLPSLRIENGQERKYFGTFAERAAEDGGLKFYHSDHLGSSTVMTQAGAPDLSVIRRVAYLPYGEDKPGGFEAFHARYQFNFKEKESTGFYDYGARLYNPATARWLSPDDETTDGFNRYAYVMNNPLGYRDPTGHAGDDPPSAPTLWKWWLQGVANAAASIANFLVNTNPFLNNPDEVRLSSDGPVPKFHAKNWQQATAMMMGEAQGPALIEGLASLRAPSVPEVPAAPRTPSVGPISPRPSSGRNLVRPVGGRAPRNAGRYAGRVASLEGELAQRYPAGVRFTPTGFPDFSPYAARRVTIRMTGDAGDFARANMAAGFGPRRTSTVDIDGVTYTWHHHHDKATMLLVPQDLHNAVQHTGGSALVFHTGALPWSQ